MPNDCTLVSPSARKSTASAATSGFRGAGVLIKSDALVSECWSNHACLLLVWKLQQPCVCGESHGGCSGVGSHRCRSTARAGGATNTATTTAATATTAARIAGWLKALPGIQVNGDAVRPVHPIAP